MSGETPAVREALAVYAPEAPETERVPPGYKQTEVGVIPEDWEVKTLSEIGRFLKGKGIKRDDVADDGVPCIRYGEIYTRYNDYVFNPVSRIPESVASKSEPLKYGDLLFAGSGETAEEIGKCIAYLSKGSAFAGGDIVILRPDDQDSLYLGHLLNHDVVVQQKARLGQGDAVVHISARNLPTVKIPLPSPLEQRAIADALSDVDALISALDKLIAKKRAVKTAAMQQLLTGKQRLPGFSGEWETKRLGEIGTFLKGSGVTREEAQSGPFACVRYGEIYTIHNDYIRAFHSWISAGVAATTTRLEKGDLLFAGSGETKEEIGKCVAFLHEIDAYSGGDIVILRPRGADSLFLGYALNAAEVNRQKSSRGQGDAVVHISANALAQISFPMPPIEEQTAIAMVLTDMDADIAALEARREKTRQVKQGMMQELLTGRVRLVRPAGAPVEVETTKQDDPKHSKQINEAVIISVLANQFGTEQYPLGRKRYTKLSYLLHRHAEGQAEGYLKKAAGPYNPATRYKGAESIAQENGYVSFVQSEKFSGFVPSRNIDQALQYFVIWYGPESREWLEQFRYKSNEELELLATVDMAVQDLRAAQRDVNVREVRSLISGHPEWAAKLERPIFSDTNIAKAIDTCRMLFAD